MALYNLSIPSMVTEAAISKLSVAMRERRLDRGNRKSSEF